MFPAFHRRALHAGFGLLMWALAGCAASPPSLQLQSRAAAPRQADLLAQRIAEAVDHLPTALLSYNAPPSMRVGETSRLEAVVSRGAARVIETELRQNGGPTVRTTIRVSSGMKAHLYADPQAFGIVALQNDEQLVTFDPDGRMTWNWSVEPRAAGSADLELMFVTAVELGNAKRVFTTVKRVRMPVRSNYPYELGQFTGKNWQWIYSALLVPLGLWAHRSLTRRTTARSSTDEQPV